jgi:hypothetical protein
VVIPACGTALQVKRGAPEHSPRLNSGELQFYVGRQDSLGFGTPGVSILGAQQLLKVMIDDQGGLSSSISWPAAVNLVRRLPENTGQTDRDGAPL